MNLDDLYARAAATPGDIHEHLPTLVRLAKTCRRVTEFGTRWAVSTTAFAFARPAVLTCYDLERHEAVGPLADAARAAGVDFRFVQANVLDVEIEPTDLLFIDTLHTAEQVAAELAHHGHRAERYLVFHDTETFGTHGELPGSGGLREPIEAYMDAHPEWRLAEYHRNNNGLAVYVREPENPE